MENQWVTCPSLNQKKGGLAGISLNDKIFAIGGGNGVQCFSEVESFDPYVGKWIPTRSMLNKVIFFLVSTLFFEGQLQHYGKVAIL